MIISLSGQLENVWNCQSQAIFQGVWNELRIPNLACVRRQTIIMTQGRSKEASRHEKLINGAYRFFQNTVKKLSPWTKKQWEGFRNGVLTNIGKPHHKKSNMGSLCQVIINNSLRPVFHFDFQIYSRLHALRLGWNRKFISRHVSCNWNQLETFSEFHNSKKLSQHLLKSQFDTLSTLLSTPPRNPLVPP